MPAVDLPHADVVALAKRVAADFEGVAIEVAALDGEAESVVLLLSVPDPDGGDPHNAMVRVRRVDRLSFARDLRVQITSALRKV